MVAMPFSESTLTEALSLARAVLLAAFNRADAPHVPASLSVDGACFVTLMTGGTLRGCIGSLEPRQSLGADIVENARHAAFDDPRFPALQERELESLEVEVSLLSPQEPMDVRSLDDLVRQLRPGVDGLVMACEGRRATFLPSVWAQLPEAERFVAALQRKAGWRPGFWSPNMRCYRYETAHMRGPLME
ncbi:MAG: AMMECR1 domain-containing protein [Oceanospirillaceae bacterium]|nr:AMMECR1 domain-containing protein [Oceanospirillaceae bacterium]